MTALMTGVLDNVVVGLALIGAWFVVALLVASGWAWLAGRGKR